MSGEVPEEGRAGVREAEQRYERAMAARQRIDTDESLGLVEADDSGWESADADEDRAREAYLDACEAAGCCTIGGCWRRSVGGWGLCGPHRTEAGMGDDE